MRILICFLLPWIIILNSCDKVPFLIAEKKIANDIIETSDGGYILTGSAKFKNNTQIILLKIDKDGNQEWSKSFGIENEVDKGYTVIETTDNGFVVLAKQTSLGLNKEDFYFLKTDKDGNEQFAKIVGGGSHDYVPVHMTNTSGNEYLLTGYMYTEGNETFDIYLVKITETAETKWVNQFGGTGRQSGAFIHPYPNGYLVIGSSDTVNNYIAAQTYLLAIDSDGNELWSKTFRVGNVSRGNTIKETHDSGFVIYGRSQEDSLCNTFLLKVDNNGDSIWTKKYNGCVNGYNSVISTSDNGFILLTENCSNVAITKTDDLGNIVWQMPIYEGSHVANIQCVQATTDGGYILSGYLNKGYGELSIYVAKTDTDGNLSWSSEY